MCAVLPYPLHADLFADVIEQWQQKQPQERQHGVMTVSGSDRENGTQPAVPPPGDASSAPRPEGRALAVHPSACRAMLAVFQRSEQPDKAAALLQAMEAAGESSAVSQQALVKPTVMFTL